MAWFRRKAEEQAAKASKVVIAEGLWIKCDSCKEIMYRAEVERAGRVCPKCHYPFRISARERIAPAGRRRHASRSARPTLATADPLGFKDTKRYRDRVRAGRAEDRDATRRSSAASRASAAAGGPVPSSSSASSAAAWARWSARSSRARSSWPIDKHVPVIIVSASGGARMQEGILSLMQMAKTSAALARLGRGAAAVHLGPHRSDHRRRHGELRDAGRRHPRRAARAHRLRRPARHRRDHPPAAARGLPALGVPARARPARPDRRAPRAQGHAPPPPRLLRRPAAHAEPA